MNALLRSPQQHAVALTAAIGQDPLDQHLTFMLGDETYAMGILAIKEIIEHANLNIHHVLSVDEMAALAGSGAVDNGSV